MRYLLSIKGGITLTVVAMLLTGAAIYAGHLVFNVDVKGNVFLTISSGDPLQILSADGVTVIKSGDAIQFPNADVDFWGTGPTPKVKVIVKNLSNTPEKVVVSGDGSNGINVLFGTTMNNLLPAPDNEFTLQPAGMSGDMVMGWLALQFTPPFTTGEKQTTIRFRAMDIGGEPATIPPPPGMVAWWPGDGNANDIVGGNHGTLIGDATATADGMVGQAFGFDGTGDFVTINHSPDLEPGTGDFTVDAWIKPNSIPGNLVSILHKGPSSGLNCAPENRHWVFNIRGDAGNILEYEACASSSGAVVQAQTDAISAGEWTHVAAVHKLTDNPDTVTFYIKWSAKPHDLCFAGPWWNSAGPTNRRLPFCEFIHGGYFRFKEFL